MRKLAGWACLVVFSVAAVGQVPKGNIFVGYSYSRADIFPGSGPIAFSSTQTGNLNGWEGSLEGKVFPFVGIVADFSGHYGSQEITTQCEAIPTPPCGRQTGRVHANLHSYLFGPRVSVSLGRFTPFAQALFGAAHISENASGINFSRSDTGFATGLGGGIDYKLFPAIAWRFQADWLETRVFSSSNSNLRLATGPVLRF
jgi:hypothetical protein